MSLLLNELSASLPTAEEAIRVVVRLVAALIAGGVIGYQREVWHKAAGLRTHMLVSTGTALLVLAAIDDGMQLDALSRVIQGVVTGIGFLGAGAIMRTGSGVQGLTTAATVWVNAAVGVAAGGGSYHLAFIATGITLLVLLMLPPIERIIARRFGQPANTSDEAPQA